MFALDMIITDLHWSKSWVKLQVKYDRIIDTGEGNGLPYDAWLENLVC